MRERTRSEEVGCKEKKKTTEREEAALYIIAHCIIYKETRNNRMQCVEVPCFSQKLQRKCAHALQQPASAVICI